MKRLPTALLTFLETLPDDTCKVILNTNRKGHWEVEVFCRYQFEEDAREMVAAVSRLAFAGVQALERKRS